MIPDTLYASFNFAAEPRWYEERDRVVPVLDAILDTPIGAEVRFAGSTRSVRRTPTREAVHDVIAIGEDDSFGMLADRKVPRLQLALAITHGAFQLDVRCHGDLFEHRKATLVEEMGQLVTAIRATGTLAGLRWGFATPLVRARASYEYPEPRPPRRHVRIIDSSILDAIDLRFHTGDHADADEGAARLARTELPDLARRTDKDQLVLLRWADDLGDLPALQRGCTAHAQWLAEHLDTVIPSGYNELGDRAERMGAIEQRPPLTVYDPASRTAYVAVVILDDGSPGAEPWSLARTIARQRRLDDGTPVDRVRVIVTLRDLALDLADEAKSHGIDAVLYPADDGSWWNPDPPGDWAYPPRRT